MARLQPGHSGAGRVRRAGGFVWPEHRRRGRNRGHHVQRGWCVQSLCRKEKRQKDDDGMAILVSLLSSREVGCPADGFCYYFVINILLLMLLLSHLFT